LIEGRTDDAVVPPFEKQYVRPDGTRVPVIVGASFLDARHTQMVAFVLDITQRKRDEEELRRAKAAAETANQAKSQFLANMSHEIRTPMTAMLGFTDLLVQTDCSAEEQREYLGIVQQSGRALLQLIDDVLDLAKIEAGRIAPQMAECALVQAVEEITSLMRVRARQKNLSLDLHYHDPLPLVIRTDQARLRQILLNLVGNAIKFTERGHVRIDVSLAADSGPPTLRFAVSDTGIGIGPEQLDQVFRPSTKATAP